MSKKVIRVLSIALLLAVLATLIYPAMAEAPVLSIGSAEDLLELAENCVLDSYSRGLTVSLDCSIDLSGSGFRGIPVFNGTFLGNGHRIDGLELSKKGSVQGLIRYVGQDARIADLTVSGRISPEGTRRQIGGIAGSNAGVIQNCVFEGEVSGSACVGGIAGSNEVTGLIENCSANGVLRGSHMVGGIAGENFGLIRGCRNDAGVNPSAEDNDVSVSDIDSDTLMDTEAADTVTDLGGIAGISTGVIRDCENHAAVGYSHMGYNLGGIAGRQKGLIASCRNDGPISGRKEVGGIAGQMEPVASLDFSEDTLQILQGQLSRTSGLASQASSNLRRNSQQLSEQMSRLHREADTAVDAIRSLVPTGEHPELPDLDALRAAKNTLSSSVSEIQSTMQSIQSASSEGIGTAAADIRAISSQLSAMAETVRGASAHLGAEVLDISDQDTEDNLTGKILECENRSPVAGDLNVGGIVGSVAWENDLDPEDDFQIHGDESMNFTSELRSVLLRCENSGEITVKKRNAGGICGNLALGLAKDCTNTGKISGESARYTGGIAGISHGFLRSCSSKCMLEGTDHVGGIAGSASIVTGCRALALLPEEGETLGLILGEATEANSGEETPIRDNLCLAVSGRGAIDGISYEGIAEACPPEQFRELADLSPIFSQSTIRFVYEDGSVQTVSVGLGEPLDQLPGVPEKDGEIGAWDWPEDLDPDHIYFDLTVKPVYIASRQVIESDNRRESGSPLLLAEGTFTELDSFAVTASDDLPPEADPERVTEVWSLPAFGAEVPDRLRLNLPEGDEDTQYTVLVQTTDGSWQERSSEVSGSYLVFPAAEGDQALCLLTTPDTIPEPALWGGAALVLAAAAVLFLYRKHRRKQAPKA